MIVDLARLLVPLPLKHVWLNTEAMSCHIYVLNEGCARMGIRMDKERWGKGTTRVGEVARERAQVI